jgi:hypothetical protein
MRGNVACMRKMGNAYKILVEKLNEGYLAKDETDYK